MARGQVQTLATGFSAGDVRLSPIRVDSSPNSFLPYYLAKTKPWGWVGSAVWPGLCFAADSLHNVRPSVIRDQCGLATFYPLRRCAPESAPGPGSSGTCRGSGRHLATA